MWCVNCPEVVNEILGSVLNLAAVMDAFCACKDGEVLTKQEIKQLEGLLAVLLGCCLEYIISNRIGYQSFASVLMVFLKTTAVQNCAQSSRSQGSRVFVVTSDDERKTIGKKNRVNSHRCAAKTKWRSNILRKFNVGAKINSPAPSHPRIQRYLLKTKLLKS